MSSKSRLRSVPAQSGNAASALVGATRADRQATRKAADEQRAREEGLRLSEEKRRAAHRPHIDAANLERYLVDDELGKIALSLAIKTEWHRVEQEEEYVDPLTKTEISGELHRFTSVHRTKDATKQRLAIVRNIVARLGENVEGSVDAVIDSLNHAEYELKESIDASVASMNGKPRRARPNTRSARRISRHAKPNTRTARPNMRSARQISRHARPNTRSARRISRYAKTKKNNS